MLGRMGEGSEETSLLRIHNSERWPGSPVVRGSACNSRQKTKDKRRKVKGQAERNRERGRTCETVWKVQRKPVSASELCVLLVGEGSLGHRVDLSLLFFSRLTCCTFPFFRGPASVENTALCWKGRCTRGGVSCFFAEQHISHSAPDLIFGCFGVFAQHAKQKEKNFRTCYSYIASGRPLVNRAGPLLQ